ncbi:MAG: DEAD/DEAH box helicase [Patescibacteria group bacterium]
MLGRLNLTVPTPIQHQAIPVAVLGKDVIGIAQTGTGKTFAFGLPLLQRLSQAPGRALIVLPTRELAAQVDEALAPFSAALGIRTAVFVGGAPMFRQREALRRNPRVLIATPGRLNDHLEQKTVSLKEVSILVLDEADRMLDMGFKPQIDRILKHVPRQRQTMLFSATMPQEIWALASAQMQLPLRIEVAPPGTAAAKVEQEVFVVRKEDKLRLLEQLLREYQGSVLVFSRTKHGAKKMTRSLITMGHSAAEIHANRSLAQRKAALQGFKTGIYRVLVATDIAARGIDVSGIEVVVNYDLPDDPADYVHRIGRTGRAGKEGRAISFATPDQVGDLRSIERLIKISIKRKTHAALPQLPESVSRPAPDIRPGHRGPGRSGGFRSRSQQRGGQQRRGRW